MTRVSPILSLVRKLLLLVRNFHWRLDQGGRRLFDVKEFVGKLIFSKCIPCMLDERAQVFI